MKITLISIAIAITFCNESIAQFSKVEITSEAQLVSQGVKSEPFIAELLGEINPVSVDLKWKPFLINKCIKHHSKNDELLEQIKTQKKIIQNSSTLIINETENAADATAVVPKIGASFMGNTNTGNSPLDNSIAISNDGYIISVANNSIEFYSTDGVMTYTNSIDGFFNDANITKVCDPVVIYDSGADKFIFFAQECSGASANSKLLICFSQTNDPNGKWWNYKLTGNPSNNNTWFDYPKMAVSTNELYITGNSFSNSDVFQEALLYQIQKNNGFIGGKLNWQYWSNITSSPFTLLPVSLGQQGNYGPGCYLVATKNTGSSTIDLFDLTDDMSSSNEQLKHYSISTTPYSPAANANQLGTSTLLDNGDCRALSGFYLNGTIHFVFHSDYSGGYNGINYNRLNIATQTNTSSKFGLVNYDYSYPSIASYSTSSTDQSVMIGFGRAGSSIYPEIRVVNCDNNMNWGSSVLVKSGTGYCKYTASGNETERWGDYTGISRKHNNPTPTVWLNGMYGTTAKNWVTWIAEISDNGGTNSIESNTKTENYNQYPNPIYEEFKLEFELDASISININIYDNQGKLIKELYSGSADAGMNHFTFNKSNLASGTYFLSIISNNKILKNEKIIITN